MSNSGPQQQLIQWAPPTTGPLTARKHTTEKHWAKHKARIFELIKQGKKLVEIKEILYREENFVASISQYKTRLKVWKKRQNFNKSQRLYIINQVDQRGNIPHFRFREEDEYIDRIRIENILKHRSRDQVALSCTSLTGPTGGMQDSDIIAVTPEAIENDASEEMDVDEAPHALIISPRPAVQTTMHGLSVSSDSHCSDTVDIAGTKSRIDTKFSSEVSNEELESSAIQILEQLKISQDYGLEDENSSMNATDLVPFSEFELLRHEVTDFEILVERVKLATLTKVSELFGIPTTNSITPKDKQELNRQVNTHIDMLLADIGINYPDTISETYSESLPEYWDNPNLYETALRYLNTNPIFEDALYHLQKYEEYQALSTATRANFHLGVVYQAVFLNLGSTHWLTMRIALAQADCFSTFDMYEDAQLKYLQAARGFELILGSSHGSMYESEAYSGFAICGLHRLQIANAWFGLWKALLSVNTFIIDGDGSKNYEETMINCLSCLICVLEDEPDFFELQVLALRLAHKLMAQVYGTDHDYTLGILCELGTLLCNSGQMDNDFYYELLSRKVGSNRPDIITEFYRMILLLNTVGVRGVVEHEEQLFSTWLSRYNSATSTDLHHNCFTAILTCLGGSLVEVGYSERAIYYLKTALTVSQVNASGARRGESDFFLRVLSQAFDLHGLPLYARPISYYIVKKYETIYGPYHPKVMEAIGNALELTQRCWEIGEA